MPRRNPESQRYVVRIDKARTHGYQLRLSALRTRDGQPFTMMFSDHMLGGRDRALAAAVRERDSRLRALLPTAKVVPRGARLTYRTCSTGVPGVKLGEVVKGGTSYLEWRATWREPSADGDAIKTRSRSFAISKHGYDAAWEKACAVRREKAGVVVPVIPPPPLRNLLRTMRLGRSR